MEKINIRIELEGELAKKFENYKRLVGLKNNSEVVRQLTIKAIQAAKVAGISKFRCPRCGYEPLSAITVCPLCETPLEKLAEPEPSEDETAAPEGQAKLESAEKEAEERPEVETEAPREESATQEAEAKPEKGPTEGA